MPNSKRNTRRESSVEKELIITGVICLIVGFYLGMVAISVFVLSKGGKDDEG